MFCCFLCILFNKKKKGKLIFFRVLRICKFSIPTKFYKQITCDKINIGSRVLIYKITQFIHGVNMIIEADNDEIYNI